MSAVCHCGSGATHWTLATIAAVPTIATIRDLPERQLCGDCADDLSEFGGVSVVGLAWSHEDANGRDWMDWSPRYGTAACIREAEGRKDARYRTGDVCGCWAHRRTA